MIEHDDHPRQVTVSWSDDGVSLMCRRPECMENISIGALSPRPYYWQRDAGDRVGARELYPEDLVTLRNMHLRGEW